MQYSFAALALAAVASCTLSPSDAASSECSTSYSGTFEIQIVNATASSKRDIEKRAALECTLSDGILKDAKGRLGYIASNRQFQFDYSVDGGLPQTGTIYDAGWAVCPNNTLVLGADAVFYKCLSGDFYNLYDENTAQQCSSVYIQVVGSSGSASQVSDGQVTATVASQQTDGQVTGTPVSQITDGQIQEPTGVVSQISDGQIQMPTGVVSQITDGQIQASATSVVSQISDGQIQATTGVVTQISDGQIQATTGVVSQISDGQIQAPTNASTIATATPSVVSYTGAGAVATVRSELFGLAAGVLAVAML